MTNQRLFESITDSWLDTNDLVKSNAGQSDSNNGVLFTSVAQILTTSEFMQGAINKCYLKPGLLGRKPKGVEQNQEQFDDVLGRMVACIVTGKTDEPRNTLWYGLMNLGFYNTDGKWALEDWLFRSPITVCLMLIAAFPSLKWVFCVPLTVYVDNFNPNDITDGNGLQLQWLILIAHEHLYRNGHYAKWANRLYFNTREPVWKLFKSYYGTNHPYTTYMRENT
jgi:hypothetical protein